ncbi:MAG: hypothetical protein N2Z72_06430 [Bacteroidales bacterium]|nr:hypothetical protein [Bacteroidales bacterium]
MNSGKRFNRPYITIVVIFLLTFAYAFIRYVTFGNMTPENIPLVITNKAIAFTLPFIFLILSIKYANNRTVDQTNHDALRQMSFFHIILSILILSKDLLPKFISNDSYSFDGSFSLLGGIITYFLVRGLKNYQTMLIFSLFLKLHIFFIGYKNWLNPSVWFGYLPPITMICFILLIVADVILVRSYVRIRQE